MSEFSLLCRDRDLAAYAVVGVAMVAMSYLNLGEVEKAQNLLQGA
ncbi:MAG: hypothetical protein WCA20_00060 [Candidatus Sulfotelmatobacter sp.]